MSCHRKVLYILPIPPRLLLGSVILRRLRQEDRLLPDKGTTLMWSGELNDKKVTVQEMDCVMVGETEEGIIPVECVIPKVSSCFPTGTCQTEEDFFSQNKSIRPDGTRY